MIGKPCDKGREKIEKIMLEKKVLGEIRKDIEGLIINHANQTLKEKLIRPEEAEKLVEEHKEYCSNLNDAYSVLCKNKRFAYEEIKSPIGPDGKVKINRKTGEDY